MMAEKKAGKKAGSKRVADGGDPLMVSVSLGLTLPVGDFQNIKPAVEISNIRVDQKIEPQLRAAISAISQTWAAVDNQMEVQITEMVSASVGEPGIRESLDKVTAWVDGIAKKNFKALGDEVKRHKKQLSDLEGAKHV